MKEKNIVWEVSEILIVALILAFFVRMFVAHAYKIPSGSMLETLQIGDYLLVTRFNYSVKIPFVDKEIIRIGDPEHNDIIVFKYPADTSQDYIKRVIGVPGDTIEIRDKMVYRNGEKVNEPYVRYLYPWARVPGEDVVPPFIVPPESYFVLGDNRDNSLDSRKWGFVPRNYIQGKAWMIYWSWEGFGKKIRWNRFFTMLYPKPASTGAPS